MPNRLEPNSFFWPRYQPAAAPFAFHAASPAAARHWRTRTRRALAATIGWQEAARGPVRAKLVERVDRGDHLREKFILRVTPTTDLPVYLLLPKGVARPPVVLAYHGHGYGVKDAVGLWEDGSERTTPDGYHRDFAVALCQRGFAVAAPEIACFGERLNHHANPGLAPTSCHHSATLAMHLGGTVLGLRVLEARRLVDWLGGRRDLDAGRLGAMGISGGGMLTLFHAALDERVRAAVVSGYLCDWRASILGVNPCTCNFVPGLGRFGDAADVAGLIAPRPLLAESGERDDIFPIADVRRAMARTRRIYARSGAGGAASLAAFPGRHRIDGGKAYPFLQAALA